MNNAILTPPAGSRRVHKLIDPVTGEVFGPSPDSPPLDLSPKQYALLLALAQRPPRSPMSRAEVVRVIYDQDMVWNWRAYDQMIDALVKRTNASLRRLGWPPGTIQAVRGRGLRLLVPPQYLLYAVNVPDTPDRVT